MNQISRNEIASYLDHTLLKAEATKKDILLLCDEAKELGCASVMVNPCFVSTCVAYLNGSIPVGCVISFPLGADTIKSKVAQTQMAIMDGANEIDYVLHIGKVKEHDYLYIKEEMKAICDVCKRNNVVCKVIFENCYLEKEEIRECALIAKEVKPDFIKTSTGFGSAGASVDEVRIMLEAVEGVCSVKAAGGIRDLASCMEYIKLGVKRIGTSSSRKILNEYK